MTLKNSMKFWMDSGYHITCRLLDYLQPAGNVIAHLDFDVVYLKSLEGLREGPKRHVYIGILKTFKNRINKHWHSKMLKSVCKVNLFG